VRLGGLNRREDLGHAHRQGAVLCLVAEVLDGLVVRRAAAHVELAERDGVGRPATRGRRDRVFRADPARRAPAAVTAASPIPEREAGAFFFGWVFPEDAAGDDA
jgi:hypothetical protein